MRWLLWIALAACGGGGSSAGTGAITDEEAEPLCRQQCQRSTTCSGGGDPEPCTSDCIQRIEGWMRKDAFETLVTCRVALPCFEDESSCFAQVIPLVPHTDFETACRERLAECVAPGDLDFRCEVEHLPQRPELGRIRFIAPRLIRELTDCFALESCQGRGACFDELFIAERIDLFGF